jgi:hypothetical protein
VKGIADSLFFFGCAVVSLQFLKSGFNRGLCCLNPLLQLPIVGIVGFEDGSFVQFFPDIGGFHTERNTSADKIDILRT